MIITVNVNVTGLDNLVSMLGKILSFNPETATSAAPVQNAIVPNGQVLAPVVPIQQNTPQAAYPVQVPTQIQTPVQTPPIQAQPQAPVMGAAVPTTMPTYTAEQLAVAATQLMDAGRKQELVALLTSFGVQALTQLPKELYGEFATRLRSMGAKI